MHSHHTATTTSGSSFAALFTGTTCHDSQIAAFLARQPYLPDRTGAEEPQVIFRGALELDRDQEQALVDDTFKRIAELEDELGYREATDAGSGSGFGSSAATGGFLGGLANGASVSDIDSLKHIPRRLLWDHVFRMKMGWRRDLWGGVYRAGQNLHMPFTRRAVQQMIARAQNHYFAAEPFCNVSPVGVQDPELATTANEWAQHKFKAARLKNHGMKAVEIAGIHGEVVIKKGHRRDAHSYETWARVLMVPRPVSLDAAFTSAFIDKDSETAFGLDVTAGTGLSPDHDLGQGAASRSTLTSLAILAPRILMAPCPHPHRFSPPAAALLAPLSATRTTPKTMHSICWA